MNPNPRKDHRSAGRRPGPVLPRWFLIWAAILLALIFLKATDLQIFVSFEYDGTPFVAGITEIETYLIPLGAVGIYFLLSWLWDKCVGKRDG